MKPQRAYGKKVEGWREFDNKPVGSASIGQVHRATLKDGTRVVGQYGAGNEQVMRNDIKHGKELFRWPPRTSSCLDEIEAQFATEFDYRGASPCRGVVLTCRKFRAAGGGECGRYSRPISEMCTKEVLDEVSGRRQFGRRHPSIGERAARAEVSR